MWFIWGSEAQKERAARCSLIWRLLGPLSAGKPSPDRWESGVPAAGVRSSRLSVLRGPRERGARSRLLVRYSRQRASR